jgi:hypothetical protein
MLVASAFKQDSWHQWKDLVAASLFRKISDGLYFIDKAPIILEGRDSWRNAYFTLLLTDCIRRGGSAGCIAAGSLDGRRQINTSHWH